MHVDGDGVLVEGDGGDHVLAVEGDGGDGVQVEGDGSDSVLAVEGDGGDGTQLVEGDGGGELCHEPHQPYVQHVQLRGASDPHEPVGGAEVARMIYS